MKRIILSIVAGMMSATIAWGATGINYDGNTLDLNNDFTRTECGTQKKKTMKEISGMACSRQTPGYIWEHGDENLDSDRRILAIQPDGTQQMEVKVSTSSTRDDWEDIATGIYGGKNYIFIGAIGDNDLQFKDKYYIYYFEEPTITSGSTTITASEIVFGYPDNKAHNTETLMYDNVEQMFYIATKVEGVCSLYKLPFKTNYSGMQTLTKVCDLGNGSVFNLCTGGDITPDGNWMAIKNKEYILLWERQGSESLSETAKRRPVQIAAYQAEAQGESLAWDDYTTFYTTSDQKNDVPIFKYTRAVDHSIAEVTGITVNGEPLAGFKKDQLTYNVVLPYGTTEVPTVLATASSDGTIVVTKPASLPGAVSVTCTSRDGKNSVTYTINFTVSATQSSDATLKSLSVNGSLIKGFDANKTEYVDTIAYTAELPVVSAEVNDPTAKLAINQVTEVTKAGNDATVVVTAQDGTKKTYTITFRRADAIKTINEVILSNSYSAYINSGETIIHGWYLAGETAPTIKSYIVSEGATWKQEGNTVTLTGADGASTAYTVDIQAVSPVAYTDQEIVFDGSETYIKGAYGWDNTKKWKFSKTDNDYSREIAGKTHVELFLPACDTVVLKAGGNNERDIKVYINDAQLGDKVKLLKAGNTFVVGQSAPFMMSIVSAQTSGDGGIAAIRMAKKTTTGLNTIDDRRQSIKRIENGMLMIERNGAVYNAQGQIIR
ncbi:MAG: hypothetical protein IJQ32_05680 [Paludibacteraceae bacterium]|nr:hypothetical protein [Paludibacteraceae bacterium]